LNCMEHGQEPMPPWTLAGRNSRIRACVRWSQFAIDS
jgi:hypothetical protein